MRLLPECSLIASGYLGFGLSNAWDCHVYLLRSGSQALLVDAGCGRESNRIIEAVRRELGDAAELVGVVLTHGHVDHSGGAADLAEAFGVPVYASELTAQWLADADEDAVGLTAARISGVYPEDQTLPRTTAVIAPSEIRVGDLTVQVHRTPGHSADHLVFTVQLKSGLAMFSGDLVFAQGRVAMLDESRPELAEQSIRRMSDLRPEHLLPGHGAVALSRGWAHLDAAVWAYDRGAEPNGLVA